MGLNGFDSKKMKLAACPALQSQRVKKTLHTTVGKDNVVPFPKMVAKALEPIAEAA